MAAEKGVEEGLVHQLLAGLVLVVPEHAAVVQEAAAVERFEDLLVEEAG